MDMRPTSNLIDMLSRFEDLPERPLARRNGKTFVRWDAFRLEQRDDGFILTFSWRGTELLTLMHLGPVDFPRGDTVTLDGMTGEVEIKTGPC